MCVCLAARRSLGAPGARQRMRRLKHWPPSSRASAPLYSLTRARARAYAPPRPCNTGSAPRSGAGQPGRPLWPAGRQPLLLHRLAPPPPRLLSAGGRAYLAGGARRRRRARPGRGERRRLARTAPGRLAPQRRGLVARQQRSAAQRQPRRRRRTPWRRLGRRRAAAALREATAASGTWVLAFSFTTTTTTTTPASSRAPPPPPPRRRRRPPRGAHLPFKSSSSARACWLPVGPWPGRGAGRVVRPPCGWPRASGPRRYRRRGHWGFSAAAGQCHAPPPALPASTPPPPPPVSLRPRHTIPRLCLFPRHCNNHGCADGVPQRQVPAPRRLRQRAQRRGHQEQHAVADAQRAPQGLSGAPPLAHLYGGRRRPLVLGLCHPVAARRARRRRRRDCLRARRGKGRAPLRPPVPRRRQRRHGRHPGQERR